MAFINKIATAMPAYKHEQNSILQYMLEAYNIPVEARGKVEALYAKCGIKHRYSVLPDFDITQSKTLFANPNPLLQERMGIYNNNALELGVGAVVKLNINNSDITHLITVSCTGMSAPGLDVLLLQKLNLPADCIRTSVNFMGCYALVHALKLADAFCATNEKANVIIVLVELCTLHFRNEYSMENIATSMLFADGCASLLVSNNKTEKAMAISSFYSEIKSNSLEDMTWQLTDTGFKMSLSAYVPDILAQNIEGLLNNALQKSNISQQQIAHWAIHPGGKKIVSEIQKALNLDNTDVEVSKSVLEQYGNMSSVTLAYVLKQINEQAKANDYIFGVAFGPGLTMESVIVQAC